MVHSDKQEHAGHGCDDEATPDENESLALLIDRRHPAKQEPRADNHVIGAVDRVDLALGPPHTSFGALPEDLHEYGQFERR